MANSSTPRGRYVVALAGVTPWGRLGRTAVSIYRIGVTPVVITFRLGVWAQSNQGSLSPALPTRKQRNAHISFARIQMELFIRSGLMADSSRFIEFFTFLCFAIAGVLFPYSGNLHYTSRKYFASRLKTLSYLVPPSQQKSVKTQTIDVRCPLVLPRGRGGSDLPIEFPAEPIQVVYSA